MLVMKIMKILIAGVFAGMFLFSVSFATERDPDVFRSYAEKESFARDVSFLVGESWGKWQNSISINGIEVEGSTGLLLPGDLGESVLNKKMMLLSLDTEGRSYEYVECIKIVADAVASSMHKWQRGYCNRAIPFPQGASCTFTLPKCQNLPVSLSSGSSSGDSVMTEEGLYSYMMYHTPFHSSDIYSVYRASAEAIADCFDIWRKNCSIVGICASGGIAPGVGPMGATPGPVRGARGNSGKLKGEPFCRDIMFEKMMKYFREHEK